MRRRRAGACFLPPGNIVRREGGGLRTGRRVPPAAAHLRRARARPRGSDRARRARRPAEPRGRNVPASRIPGSHRGSTFGAASPPPGRGREGAAAPRPPAQPRGRLPLSRLRSAAGLRSSGACPRPRDLPPSLSARLPLPRPAPREQPNFPKLSGSASGGAESGCGAAPAQRRSSRGENRPDPGPLSSSSRSGPREAAGDSLVSDLTAEMQH